MRMVGAVAVVAATALVAGCSTAADAPIAVTHVHAVDVDDQRGMAFVATHDGVLRVELGDPGSAIEPEGVTRLGDWRGDVMGMARLDDALYLSGHPEVGAEGPANIGVYRTDVRGRNFEPVALEGEVDFHSMSVGGVPLKSYGLAGLDSVSGRVMVSRDRGATWTPGAVVAARALSWDARAERLYATTEQGLQVSTDDGVSFTLIEGAPALVLIASSPTGSSSAVLVGVDLEGTVQSSVDGVVWTASGPAPAGTEAISVGRSGTIVAAGVEGVQRSDDAGATWEVVAEFSATPGARRKPPPGGGRAHVQYREACTISSCPR